MKDADVIAGLQRENDALRAKVAHLESKRGVDLAAIFDRKAAWSLATFGPHQRAAGVIAHIRKELVEIERDPTDLVEWIDVVMIAMDGAWRVAGANGAAFAAAFFAKHELNMQRTWPDWRTASPDAPIEHVRAADESGVPPRHLTPIEAALLDLVEAKIRQSVDAKDVEFWTRHREALR